MVVPGKYLASSCSAVRFLKMETNVPFFYFFRVSKTCFSFLTVTNLKKFHSCSFWFFLEKKQARRIFSKCFAIPYPNRDFKRYFFAFFAFHGLVSNYGFGQTNKRNPMVGYQVTYITSFLQYSRNGETEEGDVLSFFPPVEGRN